MSTVSVFVPTYNYARYLRECVSSVLVQDDVDVEVLIIDDASTDGSDEVARELASEDPRVAVAVQVAGRGGRVTLLDREASRYSDRARLLRGAAASADVVVVLIAGDSRRASVDGPVVQAPPTNGLRRQC